MQPAEPAPRRDGFSLPLAQTVQIDRRGALAAGLAALGAAAATAADPPPRPATAAGSPPAGGTAPSDDRRALVDDRRASVDDRRASVDDRRASVDDRRASPRAYPMKKSINLWAFPYPDRMSLEECLRLAKEAGFDGIELNYDLDNDLSPKASERDLVAIRQLADRIGIRISGLCSFLFWPYPLTSNDPEKRARGIELAGLIGRAAGTMGVENVLVVPGAVHIPWRDDHEPVPNDVCERRAVEAVTKLLPDAERAKVTLNMENIFFNGFLMTPMEMNAFVDRFQSPHVQVHFDTGNIAMFQYAEHWIPVLGKRIKNVHLKEYTKKGTDYSLETFRPLLDGTTNWPAVMQTLDDVGYTGWVTFEYFHPWRHYPEALIHQTSDSLDRMLGRPLAKRA